MQTKALERALDRNVANHRASILTGFFANITNLTFAGSALKYVSGMIMTGFGNSLPVGAKTMKSASRAYGRRACWCENCLVFLRIIRQARY
jgi:hypothetical protein